ncbi:MAG: deoxyguanosinetriphosphate triphosphohydrolase family protein [Anaerovoracaceae bacterium]|jgi:dGTPase
MTGAEQKTGPVQGGPARGSDALCYRQLPSDLEAQIAADIRAGRMHPGSFREEEAIRRDPRHDRSTLLRPSSIRDIDKILHLPLYNRYADKTQVFSFYNNDDITRRALHVQLVSRIGRNIGRLLRLNLDLIEAIALGHDLGHTPFGHAGESCLDRVLQQAAGLHFNHNVQSARVLDRLFRRNVSLQTLDGILCHNGEFAQSEYRPQRGKTFADFDRAMERCTETGKTAIEHLVPMTLEGCVVRISDMIAYLGKDRQDAVTARIIDSEDIFQSSVIGRHNAEIINNLVVDIVTSSYGRDCLQLSEEAYRDLRRSKAENFRYIYQNEDTNPEYGSIGPMFERLFAKLLDDLRRGDRDSIIWRHHLHFIEEQTRYYGGTDYEHEQPERIVADYMASMTDDYFLDLYSWLFPDEPVGIRYHSYFHRRGEK